MHEPYVCELHGPQRRDEVDFSRSEDPRCAKQVIFTSNVGQCGRPVRPGGWVVEPVGAWRHIGDDGSHRAVTASV